ncbi:MAG TPA: Rid family detoxifying hydrolase [Longimicrobiales bacterium]
MYILQRRSVLFTCVCACVCACAGTQSTREVIAPAGASRLAPYSPAVRVGDLVFLSGQVGLRPGTRELAAGGVAAETEQALENVRTVLAAAGLTPADVVKCTVVLADMRDYDAMNAVYGRFFASEPPARSAVGVNGLPLGARVEIECIAGTGR